MGTLTFSKEMQIKTGQGLQMLVLGAYKRAKLFTRPRRLCPAPHESQGFLAIMIDYRANRAGARKRAHGLVHQIVVDLLLSPLDLCAEAIPPCCEACVCESKYMLCVWECFLVCVYL